MATTPVSYKLASIQYVSSPSNSAELIAALTDHQTFDNCTITIVSETGGELRLQHNPYGFNQPLFTINNGRWLIVEGVNVAAADILTSEYNLIYRTLSQSVANIVATSTFTDAVSGLVATGVRAFGGTRAVGIPAAVSLTPATRTVAVTWPRPLPAAWGSTYDVDINPDVGLLTGPYTYAVSAKTSTGCTLSYTNATLIAALAAGTVDLTASK